MIDKYGKCPNCNSDWDGGSILRTFLEKKEEGNEFWKDKSDEEIINYVREFYKPPYRWSRLIGIEYPEKYDGIWEHQCPDCEATFKRFEK